MLVLGAGLAGAAVVYLVGDPQRHLACSFGPHQNPFTADCRFIPGQAWVEPAAVAILLAGLCTATGLVLTALGRPRPWARSMAAALTLGAALGGAAILHSHQFVSPSCTHFPVCSQLGRPGWVVPVLLGLCVLGAVGALLVLLTTHLRLATAGLVLAVGLVGAAVLHVAGGGYLDCNIRTVPSGGGPVPPCFQVTHPWVDPAALALAALGAVGAAGILAARAIVRR